MDLVHKVKQTIIEETLIASEDIVVVAVSGGSDSVALLHVLHQLSADLNIKLVVAHVNHQFRGTESDQEAEGVLKLAENLQLPCEIGVINVPAYIEASGINLQVAAREKRYEFLTQIAAKYHAHKIALAHHADDQAETMVMRLLRGSGISGLAGIPIRRTEKKVELIRPFLRIYKSEILDYCSKQTIHFYEDSSNAERKYFRNQVRLDILPYLQQFNSQLPQSLNRLADMIRDEDDYMAVETKRIFDQWVTNLHGKFSLPRNSYLSLPSALQRRLIKLILGYLSTNGDGLDYQAVELVRSAIVQTTTPSLELDVGFGISFVREYDQIHLGHKEDKDHPKFIRVIDTFPSEMVLDEIQAKVSFQIYHRYANGEILKNTDKLQACFDLDQIDLPITIRNRLPGDRIKVAGLNGSKKVKNIFIDEKVAPSRREQIPIVLNAAQQVLWIPGFRFSDQAAVTKQTSRILHMKYIDFI